MQQSSVLPVPTSAARAGKATVGGRKRAKMGREGEELGSLQEGVDS